ncbi:BTN1 protein [Rhizoctonia solani AG-1 IA]|uniref:BTN1 protein n=1 Tax=Thanatephorus cucumeris (strain AG1-IA) TaxID=983506 RepID=L8WNG8_THACA|nr:BTN1 protein [Rhizoctonia solani AG-1 IA]
MSANHIPLTTITTSSAMTGPELQDRSLEMSETDTTNKTASSLRLKLGISFFFFGLMNNGEPFDSWRELCSTRDPSVLYVVILSAALDLVPPSTPKGIIAFCNIAPSLVNQIIDIAKVGWPYFLRGKIRYTKRLLSCCALSVTGMLIVAAFETLSARLLGIAFASFASGLGELTFLQLSTTYHPKSVVGHAVGYFASGTGAAGLVGAGLWWELRALGVRVGVGLSALLPFAIPLTYFFVLPPPGDYTTVVGSGVEWNNPGSEYTALPGDDTEAEDNTPIGVASAVNPLPGLSSSDKWRLVRPLLLKYMLPLCESSSNYVYVERWTSYDIRFNSYQGISPTLVYPVPDVKEHPVLGRIVKTLRDYYPLWQLIYQAFVFLSRSSISLGLPALPTALLPLPAVIQAVIMGTLALESSTGFLSGGQPETTTQGFVLPILMSLIKVPPTLRWLGLNIDISVNVFYRVGQDGAQSSSLDDPHSRELARQEQEFRIGSIGFADSSGILLASLISMPTEVSLCHTQVRRGNLQLRGRHSPLSLGALNTVPPATQASLLLSIPGATNTAICAGPTLVRLSMLQPDDSSDVPETTRSLLEQIVSIDDLQENARHAMGRKDHQSMNQDKYLDILSKSLGHFRDLRGLTFYAEDLRSIWSNKEIQQMSVSNIIWFDNCNGHDSFLLLQLSSPALERDRWLRLERRSRTSGFKGAVSRISPYIGQSFANSLATLSNNLNDLMAHEEMEYVPRAISDKTTPLTFVLDVIDAVHKNFPADSSAYMSVDRLYLWVVMDALNQYHEPTAKDASKIAAQNNNPYRILKPLAQKKGCRMIAERIGLQEVIKLDEWELVAESEYPFDSCMVL